MARYNSSSLTTSINGTATVASPYSGAFTNLTGTAPYTVTLPTPGLFPGSSQTFYNSTAGTITLSTPSGLFGGLGASGTGTLAMPTNTVTTVTSDGTNYIVLSEDGSALVATSGSFTGDVGMNGATVSITSGVLTLNPSSSGTMNNVAIGGTTRAAGSFVALNANGQVNFTSNTASSSTTTGTLVVTGGMGVTGTVYAGGFNGNLSGTVLTAAQPNITSATGLTSVGTLSSLAVTGSTVLTGSLSITGTLTSTTNAPFSLQSNGNTGTYTQTVIYNNQNNTSSNSSNGLFIERGRVTDSGSGEIRSFVIGARGGQIQLILNKDGNLGVGIDSPTKKLHLYDTSTNTSLLLENGSTTNYALMQFKGQGAKTFEIGTGGSGTNSYNGALYFYDVTANIERMRVDTSGNLVLGYNQATNTSVVKNFGTVHSASNRGASVTVGIDDGSFGGMIVRNVASANTSFNSQYIEFHTHQGAISAGERMRIDANGVVTIGGNRVLKANDRAMWNGAAESTSCATIVSNNADYVRFTDRYNGDSSVFEVVTGTPYGIRIKKAGWIYYYYDQDIITAGSTGYVTIRSSKNGSAIQYQLITNTGGQWDGLIIGGVIEMAANDVLNFYIQASDITSIDPGTWTNCSIIWHGIGS